MEIAKIITGILSGIMFVALELYIGKRLYKEKLNIKKLGNILIIGSYIGYISLNSYIIGQALKIIVTYAILIMFYKIIYNQSWSKSIIGSFIIYCITFIAEILTAIVLLVVTLIFGESIQNQEVVMFLITNISAVTFDYIIYKNREDQLIKIVENAEKMQTQQNIIMYSGLLIAATLMINKLSILKWALSFEFIINALILIAFIIIIYYTSNQTQKYDSIKKKYTELSTYSQLYDEVLEQYRTTSHEFHNKLGIIRGMVREDNQELLDYIDVQIEKTRKHKYSWVNEVKYVQLPGLKSLINMKIMELKKEKLKLNLSISEGIKEFKFDNLTEEEKDELYSIVGVYLDNAREASKESNQKKVAIDLHLKKENLIIVIANTYQGKVDIEKIGEYNYSTKGKERGIGLHLVKKIIEKNHKFSITTEIRGNYFRQIITILK